MIAMVWYYFAESRRIEREIKELIERLENRNKYIKEQMVEIRKKLEEEDK